MTGILLQLVLVGLIWEEDASYRKEPGRLVKMQKYQTRLVFHNGRIISRQENVL